MSKIKTYDTYTEIPNGLFADSFSEEPVIDEGITNIAILKSRRTGYNTINRTVLEELSGSVLYDSAQVIPVIHIGEAGQQAFGEAICRELERQLSSYSVLTGIGIPIITGTGGESQLENEQIWTNTRNMTEQEIINYFDTISNEEQQTNTEH